MKQISLFEIEPLYTLDPCPKCGEVPGLTESIDTNGLRESLTAPRQEPTGKAIFEVYHTCRIGQEGNVFCSPVFWTKEEAVENWNNLTKNYVKEESK